MGTRDFLLSYRQANDTKALTNAVVNNKVDATQLEFVGQDMQWTSLSTLANVSWLANTSGDLNGDGTPELISVFKNSSSQLGFMSWRAGMTSPTSINLTSDRFVGGSLS